MNTDKPLPKRVVNYIHDMGVRALDHLAERYQPPPAPPEGTGAAPDAIQSLVSRWQAMPVREKERFVDHVAASVVEVVAASAALPLGLKVGKKAAKAARKAIRKQAKKLRKAVSKKTTVVRKKVSAKTPAKKKAGKKKPGKKKV